MEKTEQFKTEKKFETGEQEVLPEAFKKFYKKNKEGRLVNILYSHSQKSRHHQAVIPPMFVATSPTQIKLSDEPRYALPHYEGYYDEEGFPHTIYECYPGLKNYYVFFINEKPIYLTDNHSHALACWIEAKEAGVLNDKAVVVRLDDHFDMVPSKAPIDRTKVIEAIQNDQIDIKNFTVPALEEDLIDKVFYTHGSKKHPVRDALKRAKSPHKVLVEAEEKAVSHFADQNRFIDFSSIARENPNALIDKVKNLKKQGATVILDIDFDIFKRDEAIPLLKILPQIQRFADVCTCATSPHYINQKKAVELVKTFIADCQQT